MPSPIDAINQYNGWMLDDNGKHTYYVHGVATMRCAADGSALEFLKTATFAAGAAVTGALSATGLISGPHSVKVNLHQRATQSPARRAKDTGGRSRRRQDPPAYRLGVSSRRGRQRAIRDLR